MKKDIRSIRNVWLRRSIVILFAPISYLMVGALLTIGLAVCLVRRLILAFIQAGHDVQEISNAGSGLWKNIRDAWRGY